MFFHGLDMGPCRYVAFYGAVPGGPGGDAAGKTEGSAGDQRPLGRVGIYGGRGGTAGADLRLLGVSAAHLSIDVACAGRSGTGGTRGTDAARGRTAVGTRPGARLRSRSLHTVEGGLSRG